MGEAEPVRMQRLTADMFHVRVVEIISDQWVAEIFHMNADLMGTTGLQMQGDEAVPVFFFQHAVMCHCPFTMFKINDTLDHGAGFTRERRADRPGRRSNASAGDGEVFARDLMAARKGGQDVGTDHMLGDDGQSGSIPVQTVRAAENKRLSLLLIVPGKRIGERIVIVVHGRMDRHPGRFVDNENIFVFIDDSKRQLGGRDLFGRLRFLNMDF